MARQRAGDEPPLKDHYLTLRLHAKADGEMIDRAYWHLARLYSAARSSDPSAEAKLDDLNEAYSVLGSPARREEYDRLRDAVLGEGALPTPPAPEPPPPPLPVLSKQHARPREDAPRQQRQRRRFDIRKLLPRSLPRLPAFATPTLRLPTISAPRPRERSPDPPAVDTEALLQSTKTMRARLRADAEALSTTAPPKPVSSSDQPSHSQDEESDSTP